MASQHLILTQSSLQALLRSGPPRFCFVFGALVWEIYDCDILHIIFIAKHGYDDTLQLGEGLARIVK